MPGAQPQHTGGSMSRASPETQTNEGLPSAASGGHFKALSKGPCRSFFHFPGLKIVTEEREANSIALEKWNKWHLASGQAQKGKKHGVNKV